MISYGAGNGIRTRDPRLERDLYVDLPRPMSKVYPGAVEGFKDKDPDPVSDSCRGQIQIEKGESYVQRKE